MATLLAIVSGLAPLLLKLLQAWVAGEAEQHVVTTQEDIADAQANAGSASDALERGSF